MPSSPTRSQVPPRPDAVGAGSEDPCLVLVAPTPLAAGRISGWSGGAEAAGTSYLDALRRAGAVPVVASAPPGGDLARLLRPFAGVVLLGGADMDPASYGQVASPHTYDVDFHRDAYEMALARAALGAGVPLLGVCRGLQVINVALGGTLHQHLPDVPGASCHGVPVGAGEPVTHAVQAVAGSRLAGMASAAGGLGRCISIHHQAVDIVAPGLVVTGRAADGVVEALETPAGGPWCLAVQWHPERAAATDPAGQAVFDGFVAVAAAGVGR